MGDTEAPHVALALHLAVFFGIQMPLSRWWLSRYLFGPAEWAWRSVSYGALQPMRRPEAELDALTSPVPAPAATAPLG